MDSKDISSLGHRLERGVLVVEFERCNTPEEEEAVRIGQALGRLAQRYHRCPMVVNLHMLQLVSNELMEQLALLARRLKAQGRQIAVCSLRPEVLTLYKVLELDDVLHRYDTVEEAIQALGR